MNGKGDVLVIEDDSGAMALLTSILTAGGYNVRQADSGESALSAIAVKVPEIILLDICLPGIDGFEVLKRLKAKPETRETPVIFLSALSERAERVKGLKLGAMDFITKPFHKEELLAKVRTYAELCRLRTKLELALQSSKMGVWQFDLAENEAILDDQVCALLGIDPAAFGGTAEEFYSAVHPGDREKVKADLKKAVERNIPYAAEYRVIRPDASVHYVAARGKLIPGSEGGPLTITGTLWDITERMLAEEALREREEFLSTVLENIPDMIFLKDARELRFTRFNKAGEELLGFGREDLIGKNDYDFFPREQADFFTQKDRAVLNGGKLMEIPEEPIDTKSGRRILHTKKIPIIGRDGKPEFLLGISRDITERKKAEETARETEARFQTMFNAAPLGIALVDSETGHFCEVNPRFAEIAGRTREEMKTINWMSITHTDDVREDFDNIVRMNFGKIQGFKMNKRYVRPDGSVVWVSMSIAPLKKTNPEHKRHLCMIEDITEARESEEALVISENKFRSIIDASPVPMALNDEKHNITFLNRSFTGTFGYTLEDIPTLAQWWPKAYPVPEYRQWVADTWQARLEQVKLTGTAFPPFELRVRCKNGTDKTVLASASALGRSLEGEHLVVLFDITERKKMEMERDRLMTAIEQAGEIIVITDPEGTIQYVNPAFEKVSGYSRGEAVGRNPRMLKSGRQDKAFYHELWKKISSGKTWQGRMVNKRKDGALFTEEATISPVRDAAGVLVNYVAVKKDITEQLRLENQYRQAQKMEAVGILAGGVAHDFNNILTAIIGYCAMVGNTFPPGDPRREDIGEALIAADRATILTRQLLAFSRKQIMAPKVVDLNKTLGDMVKMLRRIIGEDIKLSAKLFSAPCLVRVDPGHMEQVIMNLVVNARDAVSSGGEITLETEILLPPDGFFAARPELTRGRFVCVKVRDNGCGMSPAVKKQIFEPFFTTKEQGKGTGLGLSMVYGTLKQSGGDIAVESEPGKGSVFELYFPLIEGLSAETTSCQVEEGKKTATETVLLVEDEESLRRLCERLLRASGYTVLSAADGKEALAAAGRHGKPVDLLITDVVMPGMSGRELALELSRRNLSRRTLYMSGYADEAIVKHGVLEPGIAFIYKPFTVEALSLKLRQVLDGPADQAKA